MTVNLPPNEITPFKPKDSMPSFSQKEAGPAEFGPLQGSYVGIATTWQENLNVLAAQAPEALVKEKLELAILDDELQLLNKQTADQLGVPEVETHNVVRLADQKDRSEYSYFHDASQDELRRLDEQLDVLRKQSENTHIDIVDRPAMVQYTQLGTGDFTTNTVTDHVVDVMSEGGARIPQALAQRTLELKQRQYWGDSDVKGCLFIALTGLQITGNDNSTLSAMHVPFNAADDGEGLIKTMELLQSPFSKDQHEVTCHLMGSFEEPASADTLAGVIDQVHKRFQHVTFGTVDVLRRSDGVRKPLFDTQTQRIAVMR